MARRLTTGFELGEIIEHNGAYVDNNVLDAVVSTVKRTGTYSWKAKDILTVTTAYSYFSQVFADDPTELYSRFAFRYADPGNQSATVERMIAFLDAAGVAHASMGINSIDFIPRLYNAGTGVLGQTGGSQLATGNFNLTSDTWYVIECYLKVDASAGQFICKINGATCIGYTGDTQAGATAGIRTVQIGATASGISSGIKTFYYDDVAINDTTGSYQNSWVGLGGVYLLKPTADGAQTDWTPSSGTVNYAMVDEVPDDASTTYVQGLSASTIDLYEVENCPAYVAAINVVEVVYQAAVIESGYNAITDVVRVGTVNYNGTENTIVPIIPTYQLYKGTAHYVNPATGTVWGTVEVNAMQAGMEITS